MKKITFAILTVSLFSMASFVSYTHVSNHVSPKVAMEKTQNITLSSIAPTLNQGKFGFGEKANALSMIDNCGLNAGTWVICCWGPIGSGQIYCTGP